MGIFIILLIFIFSLGPLVAFLVWGYKCWSKEYDKIISYIKK